MEYNKPLITTRATGSNAACLPSILADHIAVRALAGCLMAAPSIH